MKVEESAKGGADDEGEDEEDEESEEGRLEVEARDEAAARLLLTEEALLLALARLELA